jgi:hypothetical protein
VQRAAAAAAHVDHVADPRRAGQAEQPGQRIGGSRQPLVLLQRQVGQQRRVERHQHDLRAAGDHDLRRFRVIAEVQLLRAVLHPERPAHDGDASQLPGQRRVDHHGAGDVGQRPDGDDGDLAGMSVDDAHDGLGGTLGGGGAPRGGPRHVAPHGIRGFLGLAGVQPGAPRRRVLQQRSGGAAVKWNIDAGGFQHPQAAAHAVVDRCVAGGDRDRLQLEFRGFQDEAEGEAVVDVGGRDAVAGVAVEDHAHGGYSLPPEVANEAVK